MRVPRLAVAIAALAAVVAAGGAWVATRGSGTASHRAPAAPARPAALQPVTDVGPAPSPAAVANVLGPALRAAAFGGSLSALVVDGGTGARLFARQPSASLPPASTAKLLTATAALEALGPAARRSTGVVRSGDTLYLVGGGDVTLTRRRSTRYPGTASLADLAAATVRAVGTNRTWHVRVDASAWTGPVTATGWTPTYLTEGDVSRLAALEVDEARLRPDDDERSSTPALQAGAAFVAALRQSGAHVAATVSAGPAPASGFGVASVSSAPAAALVRRMLTDSDNDLAEALGRAVAERSGASVDFEGEARAVTDRLRALGVPTAGIELHDASGLSRDDRVSAQALVTVLQLAADAHHPELRPVLEGLPVAGLTGTLADRFRRGPARTAAGDVRAKTGNLVGVNTLAGDVVDADGRLLFFAFLTARATSPQAAEPALDRLAVRLRSCGCAQAPSRPAT